MTSAKELHSIDLASYTIAVTAITVLFSVIAGILLSIAVGIASSDAVSVLIYIVPTIIVGTLMYSTYNSFFEGFLYNVLAKRLNSIKLIFKDDKELVRISTAETAIMLAIISTIQVILLYLASTFLLPLLLNSMIQTLMYAGQETLAYSIYQLLILISQPTTVAMIIFGTFIITFVFVLLATYIYNIIANKGRGAVINLSKENNMTVIESFDTLKLAIVFAIISGVLNIILAIITLISGATAMAAIINIISGFIGGFILAALFAVFYNFLAEKLGKIKIELIDL